MNTTKNGTLVSLAVKVLLCGNINIASGKFYATEHAVVTTLFHGIDFNGAIISLKH